MRDICEIFGNLNFSSVFDEIINFGYCEKDIKIILFFLGFRVINWDIYRWSCMKFAEIG